MPAILRLFPHARFAEALNSHRPLLSHNTHYQEGNDWHRKAAIPAVMT
jgi:hypothetical protein